MRLPPSEFCDLILSGRIPPIKRNSCPNRAEGDNSQAFTNYSVLVYHYYIFLFSVLSINSTLYFLLYLNKYKNCVYYSGINFVKLLPPIRKFRLPIYRVWAAFLSSYQFELIVKPHHWFYSEFYKSFRCSGFSVTFVRYNMLSSWLFRSLWNFWQSKYLSVFVQIFNMVSLNP